MVSKLRVILGIVGFFMIAGVVGDIEMSDTLITFEQIIFILVGFVYFIQMVSLLRKEF
jgi:hypothetical protein